VPSRCFGFSSRHAASPPERSLRCRSPHELGKLRGATVRPKVRSVSIGSAPLAAKKKALSEHLHDQFNRLHISQRDLGECSEYLAVYDTTVDAAQQAVLVGAVVAYARPFLKNETGGRSTPTVPARLLTCLTAPERQLHGRIITLRNKAVAHSDFDWKAVRMYGQPGGYTTQSRMFDVRSELWNDIPSFIVMAAELRAECFTIMSGLNAQLHGDVPRLRDVTGNESNE
jgi:hypothetical protein